MKKLIATTLALTTVLCTGMPVLAAETVGQNGSQDIDVTAKYSDSTTTPDAYSIDIAWEDMTFTYSMAGTMEWDPATHTYEENITAGWDKESADVTVTNHSNVAVDVSFGYTPTNSYGVITALSNSDSALNLAAGVEGDVANAAAATATLSVSGVPNDTVTENGVVVGTITVQVN